MNATANLANLSAYLAGDTVSGANPAEGLATVADLGQAAQSLGEQASKAGVSVERAYFATALVHFALASKGEKPGSPSGSLDAVCTAHPIPGYGGTPKQRKTCVRAGMLSQAERWLTVATGETEADLIPQALEFARTVNLRAERDNRGKQSARPSKGEKGEAEATVSEANPVPATVEQKLALLGQLIESLRADAAAGDVVAEAGLAAALDAIMAEPAQQVQEAA